MPQQRVWPKLEEVPAPSPPPEGDFVRPCRGTEVRVANPEGPGFLIYSEEAQQAWPELPSEVPEFSVHWSDQGSTGAAGMHFLTYSLGYWLWLLPDPNHRVWNDIKAACKATEAYLWRVVVLLTLVFNLNYSPFGKGQWFSAKRDFHRQWAERATTADPHFQRYAESIARDHGLPAPETPEDLQRLLQMVQGMQSCQKKGPLVKLMRWFSWFESWEFYRTEMHSVKCILEAFMAESGTVLEAEEEEGQSLENSHKEASEELRELKEQWGSFRAAHVCISEDTCWGGGGAELLSTAGRPLWSANTKRVKSVKGPKAALDFEVQQSLGNWQRELTSVVEATFHSSEAAERLRLF